MSVTSHLKQSKKPSLTLLKGESLAINPQVKFRKAKFRLRLVLSDRVGNPYWEALDGSGNVVYYHKEKSWVVNWIMDQNLWGRIQSE